jgi:hypothetical protein
MLKDTLNTNHSSFKLYLLFYPFEGIIEVTFHRVIHPRNLSDLMVVLATVSFLMEGK